MTLGIAVGSGLQVALFVTPVPVLASLPIGKPMTLLLNRCDLVALVVGSLIAVPMSLDAESNRLEGAYLVALFAMLGIAFYVVPYRFA